MYRFTAASAALLATTAVAQAGGVERQAQTPAILFEDGTYVELSYSFADPDVSGVQVYDFPVGGAPAGSSSGDVAPSYSFASFSFRTDLSERLSFAVIYDQPIGADVDYSGVATPPWYLYRAGEGSQAEIRSEQVTAALRYEIDENFSVYGGLRFVTAEGNVALFNNSAPPAGAGNRYIMEADGSTELGYMLGAAYERADIALRVALTYYSATTHEFTGTEGSTLGGVGPTRFETTIPQQVLLEAQTGVAEGTLVFGSIRWTDWSEFDITPPTFDALTGSSLVNYDDDTFTYTIGGARRLSDNWAVLGSITYEAEQDGFSGNLGPTDGRTSLGLGVRYDRGPWRVLVGGSYTWIGDAETEAPGVTGAAPGTTFAEFRDNTAIGYGLRVGYSF
ncbi:membrane protein involved in aromatic hydrocarbon degradation [Roseibacterium elongatum DSM 19469]|uniref:Membrane protein involved in aromatic hydrocarbon degradation n=1 Tax=Roseicyclus elongatus DSM 19469 TaxID=1294273 RepID=W8RVE8_9RHOB|nr:outer membrane protein transport protein [Roseibacterium elongatum]AHM05189.1 membrane protein involved in aromatic hydrocarbon degradation [Roseibacterium elongatum DSM 19469]